MSDMMDDINKYAAIWDTAQTKGIFDDIAKPAPKAPDDAEDEFFGSDFFGQNRTNYDAEEYQPLNETDVQCWAKIARMADPLSENVTSKAEVGDVSDVLGKSHNPVYPNTVGKDQDMQVTQNWGTGGKEHFELEEMKSNLEKLESRLNSIESKGESGKDVQSKIDSLKKQIDELSDSLNGDRWSNDG